MKRNEGRVEFGEHDDPTEKDLRDETDDEATAQPGEISSALSEKQSGNKGENRDDAYGNSDQAVAKFDEWVIRERGREAGLVATWPVWAAKPRAREPNCPTGEDKGGVTPDCRGGDCGEK